MAKEKTVIGREVAVTFRGEIKNVPAKVDTGADSSAVWATDIFVDKDDVLHFKLFGKSSKYYTGKEHTTKDFGVVITKSSHGDKIIKYQAKLPIELAGRKVRSTFSLSNRSTHNYPILIGYKTLYKKFLVDVSLSEHLVAVVKNTPAGYNEGMRSNPYKFYKDEYLNGVKK